MSRKRLTVLLKLDGSENNTKLGANATLAVSLANSQMLSNIW